VGIILDSDMSTAAVAADVPGT